MAKQISIVGIRIKEITLAENDNNFSVGVWYALLDSEGNEVAQKRDLISNDQLEALKIDEIKDMLAFAKSIITLREQI